MNNKPILWVEDDPDDQELIELALENSAAARRISFVADGPHALDRLSSSAPDELPAAIILDYKLPLMDAPEIIERLQANPAWREIPVIVFTSSGQAATCPHAEVVGKPVEAARFRDAVTSLAQRWA